MSEIEKRAKRVINCGNASRDGSSADLAGEREGAFVRRLLKEAERARVYLGPTFSVRMSTARPTSGGRPLPVCRNTLRRRSRRHCAPRCQGQETSGQSDTHAVALQNWFLVRRGGALPAQVSAGAEKIRGQTPRSGQKQTGARRGAVPVINSFQARIKYKLPGPPREKGLLDRNKHICQRKYLGTHARTHACTQRGRKFR